MRVPVVAAVLLGIVVVGCGSSNVRRPSGGDDDAGTGGRSSESGGASSTGGKGSGGKGSGGTTPVPDASSGGVPSVPDSGPDASESGGAGGSPAVDAGVPDGDAAVVLPPGIIAAVPYSCTSPFAGVSFPSYFHLEDWEDHILDAPGVTVNTSTLSSSFSQAVVDSVDCDDGVVDGTCADCEALWGNGTIELTFDAEVLGDLPSHVGFVWTDGGANSSVTITGYDAADAVIYTQTVEGIGDDSISGTVEEDRFFGIVSFDGVKRVVVVNSTGGVEIDHLQFGR